MLIRRERSGDADYVRAVHTRAFAPVYKDRPPPEPGLLDELRNDSAWIDQLSMVALLDGGIIGHVCCTRAHLLPERQPVLGLGPIGVLPEHQGAGVGSALMHAAIGAADALDEPLIVLLGSPGYYRRFGFVPAVELGITPPVPDWEPSFLARTLTTYDSSLTGEFQYAEPFRDL